MFIRVPIVQLHFTMAQISTFDVKNFTLIMKQKTKFNIRKYYWDPYKRTRPLRNVPPAGFLKISCVPVQHKRTPYRPSEKTQKIVPPS